MLSVWGDFGVGDLGEKLFLAKDERSPPELPGILPKAINKANVLLKRLIPDSDKQDYWVNHPGRKRSGEGRGGEADANPGSWHWGPRGGLDREPHKGERRQLIPAVCADWWDAWNQLRWLVGCKDDVAVDASLPARWFQEKPPL